MTTKKKLAYTKSESGMYAVELARSFPHAGFTYKPGAEATIVDEAILEEMIAADVVTNVTAA